MYDYDRGSSSYFGSDDRWHFSNMTQENVLDMLESVSLSLQCVLKKLMLKLERGETVVCS